MIETEYTEDQARAEFEDKLQAFGEGVEAEAEEYERLRKPVEERMLEDMRQYYGVELEKAKTAGGSDLNVNITRKKTNTAEARLSDMLFPTDDRNWSIEPTPVPRLPGQRGEEALEQVRQQAQERSDAMSEEIEDQLVECRYQSIGREAIRAGCMVGTGVMKGPVLLGKGRRAWQQIQDAAGNVAQVIVEVEDQNPGFEYVPVWDFFPDMSATRVEDCEKIYQRHWMTKRDLIRLAKRPDFLTDQIRKVLQTSPNRIPPDYLTQLREMGDITSVGDEKRYVVWECHGPIDTEHLQLCGCVGEEEPLEELRGVVWVCQGVVIKAALNPMDTDDYPFSVFNFEQDDSCIFGYGVPYLMRSPQRVVRAAWRMIMDNAGLSVGGQIIINKSVIEPARTADGRQSWDITPLKVWLLKDKMARAQDAFHIFEFPNHQNELAAIFNLARELADEETGIPVIAEGDQGNATTTARGMEMLMNSHNIVMRRAVKNWDDCVTIPNITRIYDWNMQNNPDESLKGDFNVVAKGSSALLLKETQSRNMLNLINFLLSPPLIGWVRLEEAVKKLVSSMQHDPEELIKTAEEYQADAQRAAQQQGGDARPQIEQMKAQLQYKMHQEKMQAASEERQLKYAVAQLEREGQMMKLAQDQDVSLAKIQANLVAIREKSQADRQLMADEFKIKLETGSGI
jgi:hypothetical protein